MSVNKNRNKIAVFALIVIVIIVVIIKTVVGINDKSIGVIDYVKINCVGIEGYGQIKAEIDEEKLYLAIAGKEKNAVILDKMEKLVDGLQVNIENNGNLSNGDSIKVSIEYDKELASQIGVRLSKLSTTEKISGLKKGKNIDVFANVEVIIAGVSPEAYANVVNNWSDEYLKNLSFSIENPSNISTGDIVKVICNASAQEMQNNGYVVESYTKEYKVDKISSYVTSTSQIDIEMLSTIKEEALRAITSETENLTFRMFYKATNDSSYLFQYNNEWVNSSEFIKAVFLSKKESINASVKNYIYLFYKANISNGDTSSDIYFAFEYTDAIINSEGVYTMAHNNVENRYICGIDYADVYSRTILSKQDKYDISSDIQLQ